MTELSMSITNFERGENRFLSNFWYSPFDYKGLRWRTVEHAFQAAKTLDRARFLAIHDAETPAKAKRIGRQCRMRADWDQVKQGVMLDLLRIKFKDPDMRAALLATGNKILIEGNTWGDRYWGVYNGEGENHLGKLLMQVRQEIRDADEF